MHVPGLCQPLMPFPVFRRSFSGYFSELFVKMAQVVKTTVETNFRNAISDDTLMNFSMRTNLVALAVWGVRNIKFLWKK
jgi:hypothetical protein